MANTEEFSAMDHQHEYDVILTPAPEGGYVVSVPELPDVHTEGETREEALAMAKDAIEGYLEAMREQGWSPTPAEHERVVVATP
jgi:antitoxin HicB